MFARHIRQSFQEEVFAGWAAIYWWEEQFRMSLVAAGDTGLDSSRRADDKVSCSNWRV